MSTAGINNFGGRDTQLGAGGQLGQERVKKLAKPGGTGKCRGPEVAMVTPKGVLLPTLCHVSATHEGS